MTKIQALAKHLECDVEEIFEENDSLFSVGREEYLVLTDEEADKETETYVQDTLWAFKPDFLAAHSDSDADVFRALQSALGEDKANKAISSLVHDVDALVRDAVLSDGRGHFLSSYDGDEHEVGAFFVYRVN